VPNVSPPSTLDYPWIPGEVLHRHLTGISAGPAFLPDRRVGLTGTGVDVVFGQLVREKRQRLGLSQAEVADRAGLGERGLRNIEAGRITKPRPATVRLLADAFGLTGEERDRFCAAGLSDAAVPVDPEPPAGASVPAQLPKALAGFTGRAGDLARLASILQRDGGSMLTVAITGTAGVGKTTLAIHWAHQVKDRYPAGQLYVNLRGFDPDQGVVSPDDALAGFLTALGTAAADLPAERAERAALFRSQVAGRRLLLVLDNARDAEHVRPLLPGDAGCLVVVTSRNQLTSLVAVEGAHPVPLTVLGDDEARSLLAVRVGATRVGAEPAAVAEIIARCAQLPLALSVVAARAAIQPDTPLAGLAAELREADRALDALDGGDAITNVRAVFSWSYRALTPAAGRMFRLLGLHPGSDVDTYAAAAMADTSLAGARLALGELVQANLVREQRPGRYAFHDLLRAYAAGQAGRDEADAALGRLLDHYLYTATVAINVIFPTDAQAEPKVPEFSGPVPDLSDADRAGRWLDSEVAGLIAAAGLAAARDWPEHAIAFGRTLNRYVDGLGRHTDAMVLQGYALDAARRVGTGVDIGRISRYLGHAYFRRQQWEQAEAYFEQAQIAFGEIGDDFGTAHTYCDRAAVAMYTGDGQRAVAGFERALEIFRVGGNRFTIGLASMNAAEAYDMVGDYPRAVTLLEDAIAACHEAEEPQVEVAARDILGGVYRRLGRYDESISEFTTALDLLHHGIAADLLINSLRNNLARVLLTIGRVQEAAGHTSLALADARQVGDQRMLGYALANQGLIEQERDRPAAARESLHEAVAVFTAVKDKSGLAYAENLLGVVARRTGDPAAAREHYATALAESTAAGDRYEQAFAHNGLAHAAHEMGDATAATREWTAALELARSLGIPLAAEVSARLGPSPTKADASDTGIAK
jgi:tetratricopeptide (TPR) repeat protein/transcriptional regulator with XRE-family HTH domain